MEQNRRKDTFRTLPRRRGRDAENERAADNQKRLTDLDFTPRRT